MKETSIKKGLRSISRKLRKERSEVSKNCQKYMIDDYVGERFFHNSCLGAKYPQREIGMFNALKLSNKYQRTSLVAVGIVSKHLHRLCLHFT